jgi:hypothetical protein
VWPPPPNVPSTTVCPAVGHNQVITWSASTGTCWVDPGVIAHNLQAREIQFSSE